MVSLAKASTSFLVKRHREFTISCLHLKAYLNKTLLYEVGPMVCDAIDSGLLKDLDLTKCFFQCLPECAPVPQRLYLQNVGFDKLDMHYILFDCCKKLKHLTLCQSDTGDKSLFKIDCRFETFEVSCLPKLEKFHLDTWFYDYTPLAFGFVPSLGELELTCGAICSDGELTLSKLLHGTTCIHTLTLYIHTLFICSFLPLTYPSFWPASFPTTPPPGLTPSPSLPRRCLRQPPGKPGAPRMIWMQPEMKQLCRDFNKLRKLFVRGIFVQFDILWTLAFLAAAPSIEVWEHVSNEGEVKDECRRQTNSERRTQWEVDFDDTKNLILKELEFRSPDLRKIVLKGDEECDSCAARGILPSKFPKKDEQEMVMRQIQDGIFSPQIFFDEYSERRRRI
ncbi:hypothetical protein ZWY2020_019147 [Hordeum vulgare]|nr:hypothetical protein ZWY2020_019147 [Hordeum vulgare]